MGSVLSRAKLILGAVVLINRALDTLSKRLKASPGLPVSNPSLPFWTIPKSTISSEGRALPEDADIVIIGSGITGTSFAYHALKRDSSLRVVILEARDVCSGATGRCVANHLGIRISQLTFGLGDRNGGHINPPLFDGWKDLKERHGESDAKMLIRFRLAHVQDLKAVATEEDILKESQIRVTEHLEVHINREYFEEAREELEGWKADMPDEAEAFAAFEESQVVEVRGFLLTLRFHASLPAYTRRSVFTSTPCCMLGRINPAHILVSEFSYLIFFRSLTSHPGLRAVYGVRAELCIRIVL